MELTRTDAVFSRLSMVLFMCRNKSSRNDLKLHGTYFWKILKILAKESRSGGPPPVHEGGGRAYPPRAHPLPRGPPVASPTPTPPPYIEFRREKNQRKEIITFYDTEPPPPPILPREGRSGVRFGLRRGEIVAIIIINHYPSPIS